MPTVSEVVVQTLIEHRVDRVFVVPGESYLGLLDALHGREEIDTVVCRQAAGAGFMALTDARLTGRPGVACVSRGPGASHAAIAVHTAQQDGLPFVLLVGQVASGDLGRDAFQEIDCGRMFGGMAKWTAEVTDPRRIGEALLRAFKLAQEGVPGPVVIALPEDVLTGESDADPVQQQRAPRSRPDPEDVQRLRGWLTVAERPLVLAGSGLDRPGGRPALRRFVEDWEVPLAVSFRRLDLFANAHRLYAGDLGLANPASQIALFRQADLLLVLGARLGDITTQHYGFPRPVHPEMRLAHVHADPTAIGQHFAADLPILCEPRALIEALGPPSAMLPPARSDWVRRVAAERAAIATPRRPDVSDGVAFETVADFVGHRLPPDAIVAVDTGAFAAPIYRVIAFAPPQRLLAALSGAMGFGVPAAVAAGLRHPDRTVVCFVGDGGLLMATGDLAVARERGLKLKVIVAENRMYGSIRLAQQRLFPGRATGTGFVNPDLELLGRAFGFNLTPVRSLSDLPALEAALVSDRAEFVVVQSSMQAIMPADAAAAG